MVEKKGDIRSLGFWEKYRVLILSIIILVLVLSPSVKMWLNAIPYLWEVLYPLISVIVIIVLTKFIQQKENPLTIFKWSLFFVSASTMTAAVFGLGGLFFTIGRIFAVIFIILELVTFIYDVIK